MAITNAQLAQAVSDLVASFQVHIDEYATWVSGSATGGVGMDGIFPLTDLAGNIFNTKSPARLQLDVDTPVTGATAAKDAAELAETGAQAAEASAISEKTFAEAARDAAVAARDLASTHKDNAASSEANAATSATAASADAVLTAADVVLTAADAVSTAADAVQTGIDAAAAAASAIEAATFDPASYYDKTTSDGRFAALAHNHVKADITDFAHTHPVADITDFDPSDYALLAAPTFTGTVTIPTIRVTDIGDAGLATTAHGFQVGPTSGANVIMDGNELMSRNNGVKSTLFVNADGGDLNLGNVIAAQFLGPNGGQLLPTYSFHGDPDTGMYSSAADVLMFSAGGSRRMRLTTAAMLMQVRINSINGTAALPSYGFDGDTNTGMYRVSADILGFSAGGVEKITIGLSNIKSKIAQLGANGTAALPQYAFESDTNTGMYRSTTDQLSFATAGLERLRILANGRLNAVINGTAAAPTYSFTSDPNTGMYRITTDILGFATTGIERFRIATTVVQSKLVFRAPNGTAALPSYSFEGDGDTGFYRVGTNIAGIATAAVERMRINATEMRMDVPIRRKDEGMFLHHAGTHGSGKITISTSAPSGGANGDIWLQV